MLVAGDSSDDDRRRPAARAKSSTAPPTDGPVEHAELCRFLSRLLCSLPYRKEEEPLFVVSEVGKAIHLHGGCVLYTVSDSV